MVDRLGAGTSGIEPGQIVAALPISGAYAEFVCLPQRELVPAPSGLVLRIESLIASIASSFGSTPESAKKADLHDRVDPPAHAALARHPRAVNDEKPQLLAENLLLRRSR